MVIIRSALTAVAVLWLLWLSLLLTSGGQAGNMVGNFVAHLNDGARDKAEQRYIDEQNRRANRDAGKPLPEDYRAP